MTEWGGLAICIYIIFKHSDPPRRWGIVFVTAINYVKRRKSNIYLNVHL
jgi:hypothetical protein